MTEVEESSSAGASRQLPVVLKRGAQAVLWDCDSTLTALEGIDALALHRGRDVSEWTQAAMDGRLPLEEVYAERLRRIDPGAEDIQWLVRAYRRHTVPHAREVIGTLSRCKIPSFVISGGLQAAVEPFAQSLGVPAQQVFAVPFQPGKAQAAETSGRHPLARAGGKPAVISRLVRQYGWDPQRVVLIGDGASDLEACDQVGLFIGFAGVAKREIVLRKALLCVLVADLAPCGLLAVGQEGKKVFEFNAPGLYQTAQGALKDPDRVAWAQSWMRNQFL